MAKAKAKTRKIVTKRYKFTKTGKVLRKLSRTSHRNRIDDASTSSRKSRIVEVTGKFASKLKKMIVKK